MQYEDAVPNAPDRPPSVIFALRTTFARRKAPAGIRLPDRECFKLKIFQLPGIAGVKKG